MKNTQRFIYAVEGKDVALQRLYNAVLTSTNDLIRAGNIAQWNTPHMN